MQDELEQYFNDRKIKLKELKKKILTVDSEIDDMVFEIYGLDDNEKSLIINIVRDS